MSIDLQTDPLVIKNQYRTNSQRSALYTIHLISFYRKNMEITAQSEARVLQHDVLHYALQQIFHFPCEI